MGSTRGGALFGSESSDCRIHVPYQLLGALEKEGHGDHFAAVQIGTCMFISVHIPCHATDYDLDDLCQTAQTISRLVESWKSAEQRVPAKQLVMAGDFKMSLPSGIAGGIAPHIYPRRGIYRPQDRARLLLDWLVGLGLGVLNTFGEGGTRCKKHSWTWKGKAGGLRVKTQIDFVCARGQLHSWVCCCAA